MNLKQKLKQFTPETIALASAFIIALILIAIIVIAISKDLH